MANVLDFDIAVSELEFKSYIYIYIYIYIGTDLEIDRYIDMKTHIYERKRGRKGEGRERN